MGLVFGVQPGLAMTGLYNEVIDRSFRPLTCLFGAWLPRPSAPLTWAWGTDGPLGRMTDMNSVGELWVQAT
jgi:hypothetical protein